MRICLLLPRMPLPITLPRKALLLSRMPLPILLLRMAPLRMAPLRMAPLRKPAILCFPLTAMTLRPPLPIRMPALPIQTLPVRIQPLPISAQTLPIRVRPLPGHPGKLLIRQPPILQTRKNPPKEILLQKLLNDPSAK